MHQSKTLANRFREVLLNGTWIANTNFKDQLADVTWTQATSKVGKLNTIALLTFHINYYVSGVLSVLNGGTLDIKDKYSFDAPTITNEDGWQTLLNSLYNNAELFAQKVAQLSDQQLNSDFVKSEYGSYQRNIDAMIEHSYYHLGQITLIKKLLAEQEKAKK